MNEIPIIIEALNGMLKGTADAYHWDDHMSIQFDNPRAEAIRQLCWQVADAFPPEAKGAYCSQAGITVLQTILDALKS